jgi:peptidyl-prolyl cis-trans isomerase D
MIPDSAVRVTDAELRQYYDSHAADSTRLGHAVLSLLTLPRTITAADTAAAARRIRTLRDSLEHGAAFAAVAKRESADSLSAANGGSVGWGKAGRFVSEFEVAAWRLKPGEISQPVLTPFGYHLIRMDARQGDSAQFSHILIKIQQSDSSAARTNARADSLEKLAAQADNPAAFDHAAKALGLTPVTVRVVEGTPAYVDGHQVPSVSAWAFAGAKVGEISELQDAEKAYYLARLDSLSPGGRPSFETAKADVRHAVIEKKAIDLLVPRARDFAQQAAATSLEKAALAARRNVATTPAFTPTSFVPDLGQMTSVIGAAFALPVGSISAPIVTPKAVYVIRVDKRVPADRAAWEKQKDAQREQLVTTIRDQRVREFLEDLRHSATITDHRALIDAANRRAAAT